MLDDGLQRLEDAGAKHDLLVPVPVMVSTKMPLETLVKISLKIFGDDCDSVLN